MMRLLRFVCVVGCLILSVSLVVPRAHTEEDVSSIRWSGMKNLSDLEYNAIAPTILADANGLHILFQSLRLDGDCTVSYLNCRDKGRAWTPIRDLSRHFSMGVGTCLLSHQGVLHAAWCPTERGTNGLFYRQSADGGASWSTRIAVTETSKAIYFPKFFADGELLYLGWVEQQIIGKDLSLTSPDVQQRDVQHIEESERRTSSALATERYDSSIRLAVSRDNGKTWESNVPVKRVFLRISNYRFFVSGVKQEFAYKTPEGCVLLTSADSGLTWKEQPITEQQFGNPQSPTVVNYQGDTFQVGTHKVNTRDVLYIRRTDTTPPEAEVLTASSIVDTTQTLIAWTGNDDWTEDESLVFSHRLNDASWSPFVSATEMYLENLSDGDHTFSVLARDEAGNVSVEPDSMTFTVMSPPDTILVATPLPMSNDLRPRVKWTGVDNTTPPERLLFQYRLNDDEWSDPRPVQELALSSLSNGDHTFQVRAVDEIGAVDPSPAWCSFRIDTLPPQTTKAEVRPYVRGANSLFVDLAATDNYSATEELKFSLKLDDQEWGPFVSFPTIPVDGLADGLHQLRVRSKDGAGNVEDPPQVVPFEVSIPPKVEIVGAPDRPIVPGPFELFLSIWDNDTPPEQVKLRFRVNGGLWSGIVYGPILQINASRLGDGRHQVEIEATDSSDLKDPVPTMFEFVVDSNQVPPPARLEGIRYGNKVDLSWPEAPKTVEGPVRWNLYRSQTAGFGTAATREIFLVAKELVEPKYTDSILPSDATATHYYSVVAMDRTGRQSNLSPVCQIEPLVARTAPSAQPVARVEKPKRVGPSPISKIMEPLVKAFPYVIGLIIVVVLLALIRKASRPKQTTTSAPTGEEDILNIIDDGLQEEQPKDDDNKSSGSGDGVF